jgi:hypothetical protein
MLTYLITIQIIGAFAIVVLEFSSWSGKRHIGKRPAA